MADCFDVCHGTRFAPVANPTEFGSWSKINWGEVRRYAGRARVLMFVGYCGFSVIMFAPVAALLPVLLTNSPGVLPAYTDLFMDTMVGLIKLYFPVFLLGVIFGKVIELPGFSKSIVATVIGLIGREKAVISVVPVANLLTYGGGSLFVVVYPFAAEALRQGNILKRLIPGTIALGAFSYTMDSLPGTPQIKNIIPPQGLQDRGPRRALVRYHRCSVYLRQRYRLSHLEDAFGPGSRRSLRRGPYAGA
jgi:hypothetical protein